MDTEEALKVACVKVNNDLVRTLSRLLSQDPAIDLHGTLLQQSDSYPMLREGLCELAAQKANSGDNKTEVEQTTHKPRDALQIPVTAEIVRNPSASLIDLAQKYHSKKSDCNDHTLNSEDHSAFFEGINRAISAGEILHELVSSFVLGLDSSFVVKIGHNLDYSHLSMLEHVQQQLDLFFQRIRFVPEPPREDEKAVLGSGTPRRCKDVRRQVRVAFEPIGDEAAFNRFLTATSDSAANMKSPVVLLRTFLRDNHNMVMTHADLHPRNVMFRHLDNQAVEITSILDWEMCGWYPEYWEYVKALNTIPLHSKELDDWWSFLPHSIGTWPLEYSVDYLISIRWG